MEGPRDSTSASMEQGEGSHVPVEAGTWCSDSLTLLASAATSREPASVRLCLISCSSLSALCMRQGSDSYGNAESERTGTYHFEPVLRQV